MIIKEFSTGCGDLLLSGFTPSNPNGTTLKKDGKYWFPTPEESRVWLDDFLKDGKSEYGYMFAGRAFVVAILNENQEKNYGHIFEQNGFEILSEGVNINHNSVLTLRARVRRTKRIDEWHQEKQGRFSKWFEVIKDVVTPKKVKATNDASGGTGKVLQRKVAVSAPE